LIGWTTRAIRVGFHGGGKGRVKAENRFDDTLARRLPPEK
jgi:hypothetical protein